MRALTLTQPWASLVAIGAKRFETRGWPTPVRGPIAIHAGKNLAPVGGKRGLRAECQREPFRGILAHAGLGATNLPLGQIIAAANIVDCVPTERALEGIRTSTRIGGIRPAPYEAFFGDYDEGRYAFILEDTRVLEKPITIRGHQQFWRLPDEVRVGELAEQLEDLEVGLREWG